MITNQACATGGQVVCVSSLYKGQARGSRFVAVRVSDRGEQLVHVKVLQEQQEGGKKKERGRRSSSLLQGYHVGQGAAYLKGAAMGSVPLGGLPSESESRVARGGEEAVAVGAAAVRQGARSAVKAKAPRVLVAKFRSRPSGDSCRSCTLRDMQ